MDVNYNLNTVWCIYEGQSHVWWQNTTDSSVPNQSIYLAKNFSMIIYVLWLKTIEALVQDQSLPTDFGFYLRFVHDNKLLGWDYDLSPARVGTQIRCPL